jgi:HD-like signal output (HDOD) protein
MNGHALAVELLGRENRPAIVILTGVTEPRLAKDLIARGVDDIMFKPVDQGILAAKVRALVERRTSRLASENATAPTLATGCADAVVSAAPGQSLESLLVNPADLEAKLTHLAKIMPISQAALDVVNMTSSDTIKAQKLAAAIELDASLAAELLRIANSTFYNRAGHKVIDLQDAVVRIGQKRTGELALMMSAMGAMTAGTLSWMDISSIWRQSVAAGLAADLLIEQAGQSRTERGLFLCAIMHPLGRVVLGSLYPDRYPAMLRFSHEGQESLQDCEQRVFRRTHAEILARVLEIWNIPADIYEPLKYIHYRSAAVSKLTEPLRTRVELTQLAMLIGQIAVGKWESWDCVDFPSTDAVQRLKIESLGDLIPELRNELQQFACRRVRLQPVHNVWRTPCHLIRRLANWPIAIFPTSHSTFLPRFCPFP